ncbi:catalase-like [Pararge aegeria]|uniref:Jg24082 protein n=1 Tax=Pararge aegeria aegeria TaxID=348720 RepID=A0A8S4RG61_9NEOP|nr:catalase-like [Pararge aegeria]CAH2236187.1 jg24082 [Pararge aegeria aegeria]
MFALLLLFAVSVVATDNNQWLPEMHQFVDFNDRTEGSSNGGLPLCYTDEFDGPLTNNKNFMQDITKLNRERIPERVVHAKGTGAFGYFELTHDMSHICKSEFLRSAGKRTPIAVRFSTGAGERGSSDFNRDSRGFSVKFYTKEGNFDLTGFHTQMYLYKDPLRASTIFHGIKRMPGTNLYNFNPYWDAVTLVPETLNFILNIYADNGIPLNYRHMPGFPIHTYQVENECGDYHFVRFHFMPDAGVKTIKTQDAMTLGATDPDHAIKDLYEAIKRGEFPSWTVSVQILTMDDVHKDGSNAFDPSRKLSSEKYPLHPVGKIVLNKNAKNFHEEIEQLAFCPCHLVPGILGAPDKLFESRVLFYKDTQLYRLGKNHNNIPVNCPLHNIYTYNRDGMPPVGKNGGDDPNYFPNSYNGPQPLMNKQSNCTSEARCPGLIQIKESPADNTDQIVEFYNDLTEEGREILSENLLMPLKTIDQFLQKKVVDIFTTNLPDLARRLAKGLNCTLQSN